MSDNTDIIERVKELNRIEVIIERDGFKLGGHGRWRRCTQSVGGLVVDVNNQAYHWNTKGEWGDVIAWVMKRKGLDFKTAVEDLCKMAGIQEPNWGGGDGRARALSREKEEIFAIAAGVFSRWLWKNDDALEYTKNRGWSGDTLNAAMLGYTGAAEDRKVLSEGLRKELVAGGVNPSSPAAVALVGFGGDVSAWTSENEIQVREDWIDRGYIPGLVGQDMLVYAHITGGRVRYFSGRGVHEKRHYNLPIELVGPRQAYFNFEWSQIEQACVVVEGQADAITLGQWGIPAAAMAGVAVDDEMVKKLSAHKTFYVGLDSDKAGKVNEWKIARALGPMCRLVEWNGIMTCTHFQDKEGESREIKDANDLLKALNQVGQSPENQKLGLEEALGRSPTLAEAMADWAGKQSGADRDAALKSAMEVITQMDELSLAQYQSGLAKSMRVTARELLRMVKTVQDLAKKKDEKGEAFEFILSGVVDDWFIEYMYDPETQKPSLAWKDPDGNIGSGTEVKINGKKYVAAPPSGAILSGGILFPSKLGQPKRTKELSAIIEGFIRGAYLLNNPLDAKIMAYYVLLTWLYDAFEAVPYLRATGEPGSGKSELMRRVGLLCYRFISANGASSTSSLFRMIEKYQGTVFLGEMDLRQSDASADIIKLINLGAMRDNPIIRCEEIMVDGKREIQEKMFRTFCPKLIDMQREFYDPAVKTRCLTFKLQPKETYELVNANIPLQITATMRSRALAIRNLLLRWRLDHWQPSIEIDPAFYEMDISSRLNQVTGALMMIAKDDPDLQREMRTFLLEYYREIVQERSMTIPARAVEALWKIYKFPDLRQAMMVEEPDGSLKVLVGNVTKIANQIISEMNMDEDDGSGSDKKGKKDELNPHKMGKRLREDLQLKIGNRTNKGFYVYWDFQRMVALAKRFGIDPEEIGPDSPEVLKAKTEKRAIQVTQPEILQDPKEGSDDE